MEPWDVIRRCDIMLTKHAYLIESAVSGYTVMNYNYVSPNIALITHISPTRAVFTGLPHRHKLTLSIDSVISILHNALFKGFSLLFNDLSYYCNLLTSRARALVPTCFGILLSSDNAHHSFAPVYI